MTLETTDLFAEPMLGEAGLGHVEIHELEHDPQNDDYVNRK